MRAHLPLLAFLLPACHAVDVETTSTAVRLAAIGKPGGGSAGCGADGVCNVGACASDPDCPDEAVDPPDPPATRPSVALHGYCGLQRGHVGAKLPVKTRMQLVAESVQRRWSTAGDVWDEMDPYGTGADFFWAHRRFSVDGFGVTMALVTQRPYWNDDGWDATTEDVPASGALDEPNLLFFEQTGDIGTWRDWPLIGMGYFFEFDPCGRPVMDCVDEDEYFIHEAGYHRSILGQDGGMTPAEDGDLCREGLGGGLVQSGCGESDFDATSIDDEGCQDVDEEDLEIHFNRIRHGRAWDLHVWFHPDGEEPVLAIEDPFERWERAQSRRIAMTPLEDFFYFQDRDACDCD